MRAVPLAACALLACAPLMAQRFTLSGTVVDGPSNRPLAGVEVSLETNRGEPVGDSVTTDAQGRFAFGGLAAGGYMVSAEGSGFGTVHYGEAPDPGWVSTVRVGGQNGNKSIVFRIVPRGSVGGTVRDEFGEPMMNAHVSIVRPVWREGKTVTVDAGQKNTDDRGRYRFGNLAPGTYTVCAGGTQGSVAPPQGPVDFKSRVNNRAYVNTCSRAFQLTSGQQAQVDLSPTLGSTATVSGHLRSAPQAGFGVYLSSAAEGMGFTFGGSVDTAQGTFTIRNVPPGHYLLHANGGSSQGMLTAEMPVDVGSSDVSGLEVGFDAAATVDIVVQGAAEAGADLEKFSVNLEAVDSGRVRGARAAKDASYFFDSVEPGRHRLLFRTPPGTCVASVKWGDREIRGAAFDVAAGASVQLAAALSSNCGTAVVRAVRDGQPVPGARLVLLLNGTPDDPGDMIGGFTDDDGEYWFADLPPGLYRVWAWAVEGEGAMTGPSSLEAVAQQTTIIEVTAGKPMHADVNLLRAEGSGQ